jgi:outer membrane protein
MKLAVAAAAACLLVATQAAAQGWSVTAGPGAYISPPWEGAKHNAIGPLPWLSIGPAGEPPRFAAPDDSLGIGLFSGPVRFGVVGALRGERDTDSERFGLRPVDSAFELGASLDFWPTEFLRTRIEVKKGLSGHKGWIADVGADAVAMVGPLTLGVGPRLGWGNETYMDTYFGVTPAEALASPIVDTAFSPGAGLRYWGAALGVIHQHGRWREIVGVSWHQLTGDAADSPIVAQVGAADQILIMLGLTYTFDFGT